MNTWPSAVGIPPDVKGDATITEVPMAGVLPSMAHASRLHQAAVSAQYLAYIRRQGNAVAYGRPHPTRNAQGRQATENEFLKT